MTDPAPQPLSDCPSVIEWPVAWGEMDAFGHLNNVAYFRYFENGRLDYFRLIGYLEHQAQKGVGPILARTQCAFRRPLDYPDQVLVGTRVRELDADRFWMTYRVFSRRQGVVAAEGDGLIVSYDYRAGRKAPLPEAIHAAIERLETAPVQKNG